MPNRISYTPGHQSLWARLKGWASDRTRGLPFPELERNTVILSVPDSELLPSAIFPEKGAHRKPRKPRTPKKPRNKQAVGSPNTVHK